jgi:hypothetical protein
MKTIQPRKMQGQPICHASENENVPKVPCKLIAGPAMIDAELTEPFLNRFLRNGHDRYDEADHELAGAWTLSKRATCFGLIWVIKIILRGKGFCGF